MVPNEKILGAPALPPRTDFQADPFGGFSQFVTLDQAKQTAAYVNYVAAQSGLPGMEVLPGTSSDNPPVNNPGIYGPTFFATPWTIKVGPDGQFYLHLLFRFQVQASPGVIQIKEGINAGLVMNQFYRYPNSPSYVLSGLLSDLQSLPAQPAS